MDIETKCAECVSRNRSTEALREGNRTFGIVAGIIAGTLAVGVSSPAFAAVMTSDKSETSFCRNEPRFATDTVEKAIAGMCAGAAVKFLEEIGVPVAIEGQDVSVVPGQKKVHVLTIEGGTVIYSEDVPLTI